MDAQQTATAGIGSALILANYWTKQRPKVNAGIFNSSASSTDTQTAHTELYKIGVEILFVAIATIVAGMGPGVGNGIAAAMVALSILWFVNKGK